MTYIKQSKKDRFEKKTLKFFLKTNNIYIFMYNEVLDNTAYITSIKWPNPQIPFIFLEKSIFFPSKRRP